MRNLIVMMTLSLFPIKSGSSNGSYTESPNSIKYYNLIQQVDSIHVQKKASLDLLEYRLNKTNLQ